MERTYTSPYAASFESVEAFDELKEAANPGGRADGNRKQRGSRTLTAISVVRQRVTASDQKIEKGFMRNTVVAVLSLVLWLCCGVGFSQSLDKAKLLYSNKLYEDAKRELVAVAVGSGPDEEKAEALNLLGAIAIDEGNYDAAIKNWTEATTKFPGTAAAKEAAAKIPLAEKLASAQNPTAPSTGSAPERELPGTVLVAGSAPESPEYADQAVLEFMNFLTSKGVRAKSAFSGRSMDATLPNLLERAGRSGAASVLYVFIHFHGMENMRVECYSADGKRLWEEKVSASLGLSPAGMTESFVRRMKKKLEEHIGTPCFPVNVGQS